MASQLEVRLQQLIQQETEPSRRAALSAELGCYLARVGDFERADCIRSELRSQFSDGRFLRISIRLMLLEGLLIYYKDLSSTARERVFRANVLCSSFREVELLALTSAWLAHIDFNQSNFQSMATEIRTCLGVMANDNKNALCRVSLVLGDAFLYSGNRKSSQIWYERARLAATELGDQAAVGAITYNRAALNVQNLRLKAIRSDLRNEDVAKVHMELKSAINYQNLAQLRSLDHLLRAANVGLMILMCEYDVTLVEAIELLNSKAIPEASGEYLILLADIVKCYAVSGDLKSALRYKSEIENALMSKLDRDDAAIVLSSLSDSSRFLCENDLADDYRNRALEALLIHDAAIADIGRMLDQFRSWNQIV